jgi:SAM-dependent methyltransferase
MSQHEENDMLATSVSTVNIPASRSQADIDARNRVFWNELCGTQLAKSLGVTDHTPASLKKFDDWYFGFYPYLERHIPFGEFRHKAVLEVGLGYGTIAERIARAGARYTGLDIAAGPVAMVNDRLDRYDTDGRAIQGSVLAAPLEDSSFDWVVAIGCYHHTGNLQRALDETWRVLRPGGRAIVMVYYAYSYRRWHSAPRAAFRHLLADTLGVEPVTSSRSNRERALYDASTDGGAGAPETAFTSIRNMRRMTNRWSSTRCTLENIGQDSVFRTIPRATACRFAGPRVGLDLYVALVK